ncbi:MAG: hypothetical protein QOH47_2409 [Sphingomonadales bacterium]|jgi:hypothetical protein|nr:hypothetical protein [Sphingomonadales bacterium]
MANKHIFDVFDDAEKFGVVSMLESVKKMPYNPGFLASLNIFEPEPVDTDKVAIAMEQGRQALIATTLRGAPIEAAEPEPENIRPFIIPRLAKADKIYAHELRNVSPAIGEDVADVVGRKLARKQARLKQDMKLTFEHHMMGAVKGIVYDSNGVKVVYNYWTAWDVSAPADIDLDLDNATPVLGKLKRDIQSKIQRPIVDALQDGENANVRLIGLAGNNFYDYLTSHADVHKIWLAQQARADELQQTNIYGKFSYGNVDWYNYRGATVGGTAVGVHTDKAVIFPVGLPGMFRHIMGPGESIDELGSEGQEMYPGIVRDLQRNWWVQPELYAYPLFLNTRPDLVLTAVV